MSDSNILCTAHGRWGCPQCAAELTETEKARRQISEDLRPPPAERVTPIDRHRPVRDVWADPDPAVRPPSLGGQVLDLTATLGRLALAWWKERGPHR